MAERDLNKMIHDSKKLAILIYDFLLQEREKKHMTGKAKRNIDRAADMFEKVYDIGFTEYVFLKVTHPLREISNIGFCPVPIKAKLAAQTHKRQGNDFMNSEKYKLAEMEYTKAMQLDPWNAIYWCNRAVARIRQMLLTEAVSDCNKALELDRSYVKAYGWLGIAHAMMDHPAKAVRCYSKALRIEPGNRVCIENMNLISRKMNHTSLRILEPWYMCRRRLDRFFSSLTIGKLMLRRRTEDSAEKKEREDKCAKLQMKKFSLVDLD